ncbi:MAG: hypothetical protein JKY52_03195 [Flavobacteriales bacterium]|nr:hypothetical protein [Flavobacteriales bacterium]
MPYEALAKSGFGIAVFWAFFRCDVSKLVISKVFVDMTIGILVKDQFSKGNGS